MRYSLNINVVQVAKRYIAVTNLGGIQVRGKSAEDAAAAVRNLFWTLAGNDQSDDALLAVELLASGTDLQKALTDGDGN